MAWPRTQPQSPFWITAAMLVLATAWRLWARTTRHPRLLIAGAGLLVIVMVSGQVLSLPLWTQQYSRMGQTALGCYQRAENPDANEIGTPEQFRVFCPTAHPTISAWQMAAVRRFLSGPQR